MATTVVMNEDKPVSIGVILSRAFGVMGDNPIATFGIAFLFGALPQLLYTYFLQSSLQAGAAANVLATTFISLGSLVVFMLCSSLVQGALVRTATAYADGERATFGESVSVGLSKAVPLVGLAILMTLGISIGFVLLFVPGIILLMMWSVATPALVSEDIGVFAAFSRSRFLTKGARWKIFGLMLLLLVLFWILSAIAGVVMFAFGFQSAMGALASGHMPIWYIVLSAVTGTITSALWGTVQTSLYVSLRDWKDGPRGEALADVFA